MASSSHVGMFDNVRCRYPLLHHQDAAFQTKDLAHDSWLGGALDDYEIMKDGRLRRRVHERKWVKKPGSLLGGYCKSIRSWWEKLPDAHGDVFIYTSDGTPGEPGYRWIEFRVRFTNGQVQDVRDVSREPRSTRKRRLAGKASPRRAKSTAESPRKREPPRR